MGLPQLTGPLPPPGVDNLPDCRKISGPYRPLAWDAGTAGVPALVPEPAAFGAAAEAKPGNDEADNSRDTHGFSLAHGGHRGESGRRNFRRLACVRTAQGDEDQCA